MRGIGVLLRLSEADGALSLSGLERATGLARSTVDRITATLAHMGYLRLDGRDAVLAPRLMELGNAYLSALRLPRLLDAHADALADELDESVSLAVGDGDGIRFIHQATRRRAMSLSFRIGDLLPSERTAPGPLFATEWEEPEWARWRERRAADPYDHRFPAVPPRTDGPSDEDFEERTREARLTGWALDDQLIEPGLVAIALPVRDVRGLADLRGAPLSGRRAASGVRPSDAGIACVASVVSHTSRHTAASLRDTLLPRLRATVDAMERELREAPEPDGRHTPSDLAVWTGASKQELGQDFIESLARGLTVLTAFEEGRAALTLSEVAQATGLARATARRALITLEHLGYLTARDRTFSPTPRVLALGFPPLSRTTLSRIAQPHLADLTGRIHDSTALAVLVGEDIQFTAHVPISRIMSASVTVGTRLPAAATSVGRVILADLPPGERTLNPRRLTARTTTDPADLTAILEQVHRAGYALVDEELEEGLRSLAVPVRDRTGRVVAAVSVAMHTARRTPEQCLAEVLPDLRDTAARVEADLSVAGRFARVSPA
ncbi:IclR family transcriptional regulator domain-containing protein [Streptomyces sp. SP18BB07]|uniref:IclR family transcriptional regulator domain-containing protein n=1 Tax=Streptomyces sp. SP18BB07 TaxID=3002522 RepID=UPI002E791C5E|nr:IclR family transcriptional regulator C-terminal domain-containing protein [Streptomyces sp. SP18BB07]MEE1758786.1 IclR family transcriptional regulator C-terminal domain-containing protein [Streptomyces sp. SP18BB07]